MKCGGASPTTRRFPRFPVRAPKRGFKASVGGGERAADAFQRLAFGRNTIARRDHGRREHQHRADNIAAVQAPARAGVDQRAEHPRSRDAAAAEAKKKITIQAMVWAVADKMPRAKRYPATASSSPDTA